MPEKKGGVLLIKNKFSVIYTIKHTEVYYQQVASTQDNVSEWSDRSIR